MSIKCRNQNCRDNDNENNCTHKIGGLSFDARGQCEKYCSKYNCIVCSKQIIYINANLADICDECQVLIDNKEIRIIDKDDFGKYGLQRAKVGKEVVINKENWKLIKTSENKDYKILKRIKFGSQF